MPRQYTLRRRADAKADTQHRIVAAAADLFLERGVAAASTLAIAHVADVAPATVRNHFPDQATLLEAVMGHVLAELQPPTPDLFADAPDVASRITILAAATAAFYERSHRWWRAYQREPALLQGWAAGAAQYAADEDAVFRAALGDLASDEVAFAVLASLVGPPGYFALRDRGLTEDQSVAATLELLLPWLGQRARALAAASPDPAPAAGPGDA
jgi:AcrR family transcriptional regulator